MCSKCCSYFIYVGPKESAMWALGDKIASSIVAQTAGVPTLPWNGDGLVVKWTEEDMKSNKIISVPDEIYKKGCLENADEGLQVFLFFFTKNWNFFPFFALW